MEKIVKAGLRDCTVNLDGSECAVRFDSCFRVFAVRNDSAGDVFISKTAGIVPDDDGVMCVKSGASAVYAHMDIYADTVYLLGNGKVQLHAQNDTANPFEVAPEIGGVEAGISELKQDISTISKEYYSVKFNSNGIYSSPYGWNGTRGYSLSNLIPRNAVIKSIECKNNITSAVTFGIVFSDKNGKCLKLWDKTGFTGKKFDLNYITPSEGYLFIVVKNASSVQLAFSRNAVDDAIGCFQINYNGLPSGGFPTEGTTYNMDFSSNLIYPSFNVIYNKITEDFILNITNKYRGKKIAFMGDSLTAGYLEGGGYVARPYPTVVKDILELSSIQNLGISSTTVSTSGNPTNAMCERYNAIDNDVDYICVMGGTNDHINASTLGSIDDTTKDTFYGALYVLFNGVRTIYPNAKLIYFVPIQKSWVGNNTKDLKFKEYINAIREMCEECSVEMIDLYSRSGLSFKIEENKSYYDGGLHLNQNGYEFLGKRIAELLLSI